LIRTASTTLPVFGRLLTDFNGSALTTVESQTWLRQRWTRREWRTAQAMARGSNGALVPTCQLCSANVPETTGHFYTCSGAWAADYPHLWKHRVGAALQELGAARPARAADALWRSLTDSHWS
jgi:hypothetical protein